MTTQDVIKLLPLDDELKTKLVASYEFMNPQQRFTLERLAWNTYDMVYQEELDKNMFLQNQKVLKGEDSAEKFVGKAFQKTEDHISKIEEGSVQKADLEAARKAMEFIVREIQASKKTSRHN